MIVAGEASGDLHGADLAAQILARDPGCDLFGIAGEQMRAAGVRALTRTEDIAGLGLAELASTIRNTLGVLRELKAMLRSERPDLVILIDFAEFNMSLAGAAKRAGVPVLYYITPQVWAWRRGRVARIIKRTDRLAVVLPFEAEIYAAAGPRVTFVGHPLLDRVAPAQDRAATLKRHGLPAHARLLTLLPGSRRGEVRYLLRPMVEAARVLEADHGLTAVIALAPTLTLAQLREEGRVNLDGIRVIEGDTYSIVAASELALAASGTATLETALLGCPMVVAYKMSPLTVRVGADTGARSRFYRNAEYPRRARSRAGAYPGPGQRAQPGARGRKPDGRAATHRNARRATGVARAPGRARSGSARRRDRA